MTYNLIAKEFYILFLKTESVVFLLFIELLKFDYKVNLLLILNTLNTKK